MVTACVIGNRVSTTNLLKISYNHNFFWQGGDDICYLRVMLHAQKHEYKASPPVCPLEIISRIIPTFALAYMDLLKRLISRKMKKVMPTSICYTCTMAHLCTMYMYVHSSQVTILPSLTLWASTKLISTAPSLLSSSWTAASTLGRYM